MLLLSHKQQNTLIMALLSKSVSFNFLLQQPQNFRSYLEATDFETVISIKPQSRVTDLTVSISSTDPKVPLTLYSIDLTICSTVRCAALIWVKIQIKGSTKLTSYYYSPFSCGSSGIFSFLFSCCFSWFFDVGKSRRWRFHCHFLQFVEFQIWNFAG